MHGQQNIKFVDVTCYLQGEAFAEQFGPHLVYAVLPKVSPSFVGTKTRVFFTLVFFAVYGWLSDSLWVTVSHPCRAKYTSVA